VTYQHGRTNWGDEVSLFDLNLMTRNVEQIKASLNISFKWFDLHPVRNNWFPVITTLECLLPKQTNESNWKPLLTYEYRWICGNKRHRSNAVRDLLGRISALYPITDLHAACIRVSLAFLCFNYARNDGIVIYCMSSVCNCLPRFCD
jgi:hypothetical protein